MVDDWDTGSSWQEDGWDDDAPAETVPCPECGAEVYEDAEQCVSCGEWITKFHSP